MRLTGFNFIGKERSGNGSVHFYGINPATGEKLLPAFVEATPNEIDLAIQLADSAFSVYSNKTGQQRAVFLEAIADEILALGPDLVTCCCNESGLPEGRIIGERGRTVNQLKLFAQLLREGSWVDARIDKADPDRQPIPKPDVRSMQKAIGPVGVFGASNFPLAFSVAGGDTASALAAGCPIVVKAHPAHPSTCEMIASAIIKAVEKTGMPDGTFSMVQGPSKEVGLAIVQHPFIKAIGFTGSYGGGKAIFDAASSRPEPIPVYAEMGSTNPVFILPEALRDRQEQIAKGLSGSVTLGVGQFCTNPGLVVLENSKEAQQFQEKLAAQISNTAPATMLSPGIYQAYENGVSSLAKQEGVELLAKGKKEDYPNSGTAQVLKTKASVFLNNKHLEEEVFGPSTLAITAESKAELLTLAKALRGHLTATVFGTPNDLETYRDLIPILEQKAGRLIINAFPTGVEVCHAMVHGGPFPATTDSRSTSVGTTAITRFTRPICYQGFSDFLLPEALKKGNPLGIWRLVDGQWGKE